ncbi:MAG: rhamnulokinase [Lachnospiraceae bacterium]|jgi:rhamnulokinase|nr:rhamnulokinase [Lachnospiraceae bacterium]
MREYFLAVDIGASGGRHIVGSVVDGKMVLDEVYRFGNGMDEDEEGTLYWDTDRLLQEIVTGLVKCRELGKIPTSMAIDTWGVDFVLLDGDNRRIGPAVAYRDSRTKGMDEAVYQQISEEELYARTGIQKAIYNTIYQLEAVKKAHPERLKQAQTFLMMPDYLNFLLTGKKAQEYTEASTTQLLNPKERKWDLELIEKLGYPGHLFGELSMPGTKLGGLSPEIRDKVGFDLDVYLAPSHDTASAVLAVPSNQEDICYISSGTWSLMGVLLNSPDCSEKSRQADLTNEGGYGGKITYLANIMGLWMIQSVRNAHAAGLDYGTLCEMASKEQIGSLVDCQDETFLAPEDMALAVQEYCKKTGQEVPRTVPEIAAVIYNSLARCYREKLLLIEGVTGKRYDKIHIVGGGSNAAYLNALTAKATGRDVIAGPGEATAIGNILSQMIATGVFENEKSAKECVKRSFDVKIYHA